MKTLLVPTDFSKASLNAFQHAIKLARHIDAKVKVAHVYNNEESMDDFILPTMVNTPTIVSNNLKDFISHAKISKLTKTLIHSESFAFVGKPANKIVSLSKSPEIDLLVMGATGERDIPNRWFGSESSYAAQEAFCPVLLIPSSIRFRKPKNILYACNMDEPMQTGTLDRISYIAKCLGSQVHILHVNPFNVNTDNTKQLINREWNIIVCEKFPLRLSISKNENVVKAIDSYSTKHKIDLIIISTYHETLFDKFFQCDSSQKMDVINRLPLLILHKEDKFSMF